jgi:chaperonin cofactor prefoldin
MSGCYPLYCHFHDLQEELIKLIVSKTSKLENEIDKSNEESMKFQKDFKDALKKDIDEYNEVLEELNKRIERLELTIKELQRFQDITHEQYKKIVRDKKPYNCPVCDGEGNKGIINENLDPSTYCYCKNDIEIGNIHVTCGKAKINVFIDCVICKGKGIVWG